MTVPTYEDVVSQIISGAYDDHLAVINKTISERLSAVRSSRTAAEYNVGDRIVMNDRCGTRYLVGHTGYVIAKRRTKVVVKLDKPAGRFVRVNNGITESSEITVPVVIIDKI